MNTYLTYTYSILNIIENIQKPMFLTSGHYDPNLDTKLTVF